MSHPMRSTMKRVVPRAALAVALMAGAAVLSVTSTARGASERQQAATIELTQTCSPNRVSAGAQISIEAVVANTGDQAFSTVTIGADAGDTKRERGRFRP